MSKQHHQVMTPINNGPVQPTYQGMAVSVDDLSQDAGHGLQNVSAADLATPIIRILQSNSPQCKRSDGEYIDGAVEGMFYNNVTRDLFDGNEGINVIPCFFEKVYIEWRPNRGGFVAIHPANTALKDQTTMVLNNEGKSVPTLQNGNTLTETNQHYVLMTKKDGTFTPAVISLSSSGIQSSRQWNSLMSEVKLKKSDGGLFTPASYYMTYKITSKPKTKDKYSWYVYSIAPAGATPTRELYDAGKAFEKAVSSGAVKIRVDEAMQSNAELSDDNQASEHIPF